MYPSSRSSLDSVICVLCAFFLASRLDYRMARIQQQLPVASSSNATPLKKIKTPKVKKAPAAKPSASQMVAPKLLASSESVLTTKRS